MTCSPVRYCTPAFLRYDPRFEVLSRKRRAVWQLAYRMEVARDRYGDKVVDAWSVDEWCSPNACGMQRYLFLKYTEEMRRGGYMEADSYRLISDIPAQAFREDIPSDHNAESSARSHRAKTRFDDEYNQARQAKRDQAKAEREKGLANGCGESVGESVGDSPKSPHVHAHVAKPKPSLAKPSLKKEEPTLSLSQAKPGLEPSSAGATPPPPGKFKHRAEPNEEELAELQTRFSRADIAEAVRRVRSRSHFDGAGNWVRYLSRVLSDILAEKQLPLPAPAVIGSVPGGQADQSDTPNEHVRVSQEQAKRLYGAG